ncbi:MAG: GldG family protein [Candidatus Roizmanbacteria bacterium]
MKIQSILSKLHLGKSSRDVVVGVIIAVLVGVNVLIAQVPFKVDLSRGRAYTLSAASQKIVSGIKDPIEITFFANGDLPTKFQSTRTEVSDLLSEYKRASSKLTIKTVDPKTDDSAKKLVTEFQIPQLEFSSVENDQFAVSNGYFGIGIKSKDKTESIPAIDTQTLEYNISSALYKLSTTNQKKIGMFGGGPDLSQYGQPGSGETIETLRQILSQQSVVEQIDLKMLDQSVRPVIVLDGAKSPITEESIAGLKAYLNKGGAAIFMTEGVSVSNDLVGTTAPMKLKSLLDEYGIAIQPNLVLSNQSEIVNFGTDPSRQYISNYRYWIRTNIFNPAASYMSNVGSLTFPWTSSVSVQKKSNVTQTDVVRSTAQSWTTTDISDLKPTTEKKPTDTGMKKLIAYAKNQNTKGEIVVIPSTRFVQDAYLGRSGNLDFMINLVNEFSSGGALSGIRARAIQTYPLPSIAPAQKDLFKWGNVFLLPVVFVLYGILRLRKRV